MALRDKLVQELAAGAAEISLKYDAKNYAVNVMILRRLSLIFAALQKGGPLSKEEAEEVSRDNKALQEKTETDSLAELQKHLDYLDDRIVLKLREDFPGDTQ